MTRAPLRVLLIAEESAGLQTLKLLLNSPHQLVGLLATPSPTARAVTVWNSGQKLGIPCQDAKLARDPMFAETVRELGVDVLLNVHSLFRVHSAIIDACRVGAWNMHPGPLPHYAGLNVPSWAIYNGETEHAVTIHRMTADIDAGSIAFEAAIPIEPDDTGYSLTARCIRVGVPMINQLLNLAAIDPDLVPARSQDVSRRRYFNRKAPNAGQLEWDWPARDVVNHIRASDYSPYRSPWGAPETRWNGQPIGVLKAERTFTPHFGVLSGTVGETTDRGVLVAAADEWVLVRHLMIEGQKADPALTLTAGGVLSSSFVAVG